MLWDLDGAVCVGEFPGNERAVSCISVDWDNGFFRDSGVLSVKTTHFGVDGDRQPPITLCSHDSDVCGAGTSRRDRLDFEVVGFRQWQVHWCAAGHEHRVTCWTPTGRATGRRANHGMALWGVGV